jgi:sugar phosphate isomerase/epimerase
MISRRNFFKSSALTMAAGTLTMLKQVGAKTKLDPKTPLKLGLVTYNLAKDWNLDTLIKNCAETKFEAVELRTTHAHKVEIELTADQRKEVRKKFADSPVKLASLGSTFEFDSPDEDVLKKNIEGCKIYIQLAADVGAEGVKVRPNNLHTKQGIPEETTLEQIGASLAKVATFAKGYGVEIRVEVHGAETCRVPRIKKILDYADNDNVFACWNSNQADLDDSGLEANYKLLEKKIHFVHMRDLYLEEYPWRKMLQLLRRSGYHGYCCAELGSDSADPLRIMRYYRTLFLAYQDIL